MVDWERMLAGAWAPVIEEGEWWLGEIRMWWREWPGQSEVGFELRGRGGAVALLRDDVRALRNLVDGVVVLAGRLAPGCEVANPGPVRTADGGISAKVRVIGTSEERDRFDLAMQGLRHPDLVTGP